MSRQIEQKCPTGPRYRAGQAKETAIIPTSASWAACGLAEGLYKSQLQIKTGAGQDAKIQT